MKNSYLNHKKDGFFSIQKILLYITLVSSGLTVNIPSVLSQQVSGGSNLGSAPAFLSTPTVTFEGLASCPVPSFNITAFGGNAEDFGRTDDLTNLSDSTKAGTFNYGAAVGFNIPLGSPVSKFCKEFSEQRASYEGTRVGNQLRNAQLSLLQQCYWLQTSGFLNSQNETIFKTNPNFSSLSPCFEISLDRSNASIVNPVPELKNPPSSETKPAQDAIPTIREINK